MRKLLIFALALWCGEARAQEAFSRPYWLDRPVIEVIGRARIEAQADRARFWVAFSEVARDAREAECNAADRARLAVAAMRARGGDAVEISSEISVEANFQEYRDNAGEVFQREGAPNVTSYTARIELNVRVLEADRAPAVRAAAFAVGPEEAGEIGYVLDDMAGLQQQAYIAAVADAVARARGAAHAAGGNLGPLLVLQEGQGPCLGRWATASEALTLTRTLATNNLLNELPASIPRSEQMEISVTGVRSNVMRVTAEDISRLDLPEDRVNVSASAQVCAIYAAS
jgi:uncharacterized protein YggE